MLHAHFSVFYLSSGISAGIVLSGLAVTCVRLDETQLNSAWDWLPENDVTGEYEQLQVWVFTDKVQIPTKRRLMNLTVGRDQ